MLLNAAKWQGKTVSKLLRENQQGGKITPLPHPD